MENKIINNSVHNWVNNNRDLLRQYKGKWIAYNEKGLLLSDDTLKSLCEKADKITSDYIVYFIDPFQFGKINFRAIHFRSVFFHDWVPLYKIDLSFEEKSIQIPMLIDSGADGSLISYETGLLLELQIAPGETRQEAQGIGGGKISYVWRDLQITIEGQTITAPVAWILEGEKQENIIGRQVVFDAFDIEFKQADEQILFRYRTAGGSATQASQV
jgi:Family of unknown function (DUF5678)/Aspartyl protease